MQITRGNYSQYANMVQQMFGNKKNPNNPLAQCDYKWCNNVIMEISHCVSSRLIFNSQNRIGIIL